jgi:peptidyl-prolyl cis-trans isomerase B (cyclophilin B)
MPKPSAAELQKAARDLDLDHTTYEITLDTTKGPIRLALDPDSAPGHVRNMVALAESGYYDGVVFHRIIKGVMIQGGCPQGTGTGGPGYTIKAEFNAKPHVRGVNSMARSQHPDSAGCQFFICHGDARFLDRQYTAFGQVVKGDDVLERLATVPTGFGGGGGEKSTPAERIAIESIRLVPAA